MSCEFEKLEEPVELRVPAGDAISESPSQLSVMNLAMEPLIGLTPMDIMQETLNSENDSSICKTSENETGALDVNAEKASTSLLIEGNLGGPRTDEVDQPSSSKPTVSLGYIGLEGDPDAEEPPVICVDIGGHQVRMLVDSGCGTYVLSEESAEKMNIPQYPTTPIPVELAVRQASRFSLSTRTKKLSIGIGPLNGIQKSFYLAPLPSRYDAIVGIPFIKEFNVQFPSNRSTIIVNGMEVPTIPEHPEPLEHLESSEHPELSEHFEPSRPLNIAVISRAKLKKMIRRDIIDEIYLATIKLNDTKEESKPPEWIQEEFGDVFLEGLPPGPPPPRKVEHTIPLIGDLPPPFKGIFRLSQAELFELRTQLQQLLRDGKISPSTSPYGAPVLFVKKKGGGLRMCIDYQALNSQTVKNRYAIPRIDELFDRLHGARVFTRLDLTSGYWQIAIAMADRHKTAFRTRYGHYEFNVMPFGLTNAPATFQSLMNDIFRDMLDVCVLVYLDNILIYSKNPGDHEKHVREVLKRLREHKLYAKPSKCAFFKDSLEYLGHVVAPDGIKPNPTLVRAIVDFPQPDNLKALQSFLGMTNFYRRFIKDYSWRALPLTNSLRGALDSRPIFWNGDMVRAFEDLKKALISAPCLRIPDPDDDFEVTTDASEDAKAVGCVLTQNGHPVAFDSKKLDIHQVNYTTHDKEMCAIMHVLTIWRPFLLGKPFKVYTDHRSLTHLKTQPNLNQRQIRWLERAADYDCEILYKPGKENVVADALSRVRIASLSPLPSKSLHAEIIKGYRKEPFASLIQKVRENGGTTNRFKIDQNNLFYYRNDEYEPWRLCLPDTPYRKQVIHENHDLPIAGHPGYIQTYAKISRLYYWPKMNKDIRIHAQECDACQRTKPSTQKPSGELQSLPIPERPWQFIGMDFLGPVPESRDGNNMILVVIDLLTKMAHFVPTTSDVSSKEVADLFLRHIFRYHGLPDHIVSDRDPKFTARFWKNLTTALGIHLRMSTAAHPQTDGQSADGQHYSETPETVLLSRSRLGRITTFVRVCLQ